MHALRWIGFGGGMLLFALAVLINVGDLVLDDQAKQERAAGVDERRSPPPPLVAPRVHFSRNGTTPKL